MTTERRAILESVGPSHYVVHFDEDSCVACVPKKLVLMPANPSVGDTCSVQWSDGVEYAAKVVAMGTFVYMYMYTFSNNGCLCIHQKLSFSSQGYTISTLIGDAATAKKAERKFSQELEKENHEEPVSKRRNTEAKRLPPKTPSKAKKKREEQFKTQTSS